MNTTDDIDRIDDETATSTELQGLVFADLELGLPEDLYWRTDAQSWPDLARGRIEFLPGGSISSDTFYNGLTVAAWKGRCGIADLALRLHGRGDFIVTFGLHRAGQATVWLGEHDVRLEPGAPARVPMLAWAKASDGMLFFRLRARERGVLDGAAYVTADAPRNDVRLGIVVTHFNRQQQVGPAVVRLERALLERPDLAGRVTLTVVDNSRNLELAPHPAVRHVANRNLGGTGGFVRGLLTLIDGGAHSHCLFMDDDASCEAESIARTLALLRYARDPALAVAGALLRELAPWHLVEKGARFDGEVRPLHAGLDMRRVGDLLATERGDGAGSAEPDYGAWWFFAFPIAGVKRFPFPFFVRGDDIHFGLANRFRIATLNGVACLGEDFSAKHGPLTAYLDARYHLVHALLGEGAADGGGDRGGVRARLAWVARRLFLKSLTAYQYSSARAVTLALRHVLAGPAFFRDNLDLQAVRTEIASWRPDEKLRPVERGALRLRGGRRRPRESALRRFARVVSLQGFLLPGFLLLDRTLLQDKAFHGRAGEVFRFRRVLYEHTPSGTGFVAEYDRPRFFAELAAFSSAFAALFARAGALRSRYRDGADKLASEAFWREVYREEGHGAIAPPASTG